MRSTRVSVRDEQRFEAETLFRKHNSCTWLLIGIRFRCHSVEEKGQNIENDELNAEIRITTDRALFMKYTRGNSRILSVAEGCAVAEYLLEKLVEFVTEWWPGDLSVFGYTVAPGEVEELEIKMEVEGKDEDGDTYTRDEPDCEDELLGFYEENATEMVAKALGGTVEEDSGLLDIHVFRTGSTEFVTRDYCENRD